MIISNLDTATLQHLWWLICSVVGSLFLFLCFVQGGQTLLREVAKNEIEKTLVINSLGRKWELTFTTLVLFAGAIFASFPKLYATSFGGAYWLWILICFTFVIQAVSYEYRTKPGNLLGAGVYEFFLFINGSVPILLIGVVMGTFFTGANFVLNKYSLVTWNNGFRGLEALLNLFNLSLGVFFVFNSRTLGAMYLLNNIDFNTVQEMQTRLKKAVRTNFLLSLPFLTSVLIWLLFMTGFGIDDQGIVTLVEQKYRENILANPWIGGLFAGGLFLMTIGVFFTTVISTTRGIWPGGLGTFLVGLALFLTVGFNNTPFYPSKVELQSSLTIFNASSSHYTLTIMTYIGLSIPFVLLYIILVWRAMAKRKLGADDIGVDAY